MWGGQQNEGVPDDTNRQNHILQILTYYKILYNKALIPGSKSQIKAKSLIELYSIILKRYPSNYR